MLEIILFNVFPVSIAFAANVDKIVVAFSGVNWF